MALAVAALAVAVVPALGAGPAPEALFDTCTPQGGAAGQCNSPRGIATDPSDGHVFVADQINRRIDEFDPWGQFVKAWGYDVVESGPDESGTGFEVCNVAAHPADVCQSGTNEPDGAGGSSIPVGVAVDSEGDVYVYDFTTRRLQKFDPSVGPDKTAAFLWAIGRNVDKTKVEEGGSTQAEKNICTATSGDECKIGEAGSGPGEFEIGILGAYVAVDTSEAVYPEDALYVGDKGRVQRFDTAGAYKGDFATPEAAQYVQSLAVDGSGDLYAAYRISGNNDQPDVHKLSPAGSELCSFEVENPRAIAVSGEGALYAYDKAASVVRRFGSACGSAEEAPPVGEGEGLNSGDTGLATGSACLTSGHDLYLGNSQPESFLRVYGPAPDKTELCPQPPKPPEISAQLASSVEYRGATLRARINPWFWNDTRFYVEYGTGKCSEGGCPNVKPAPPGSLLTSQVTDKVLLTEGIDLSSLDPATTYHYRFVAQSGGGGPVRGVGGTEAEDGAEGTFRTFALPGSTSCPNEALRSGPGALLPDCRGYEMVSPVDKNGANIYALEFEGFDPANFEYRGLDQATPDGGKLAYSASGAFGGSDGSPIVPQYVATRGEGTDGADAWSSEPISPAERGGSIIEKQPLEDSPAYKAFSPDLGTGWVIPESGLPLAPCASEGYYNLYRREMASGAYLSLCTAPTTEACPEFHQAAPLECRVEPEFEGYSSDQSRAVFRVNAPLTAGAQPGRRYKQVYEWDEGTLRLVSALPGGEAQAGGATAGSEEVTGSNFDHEGNALTVEHALSGDGKRVYWSSSAEAGAHLYLRTNAEQPQSAVEAPGGDVIGLAGSTGVAGGGLTAGSAIVTKLTAAEGSATVVAGSAELTEVKTEIGRFLPGQPIEGKGIPSGATVLSVGEESLSISAAASESGGNVKISSEGPAPFAVGERIVGEGVAPHTTIAAVGPGTLTLSAPATKSTPLATRTPLHAYSQCSEPERACTLPVSELVAGGPAQFWDASPDGSRAIFSLVPAGNAAVGPLYEYDLASEEAKLIVQEGRGVLGASTDLSKIYLASTEVCGEENAEGGSPTAGQPNVYLYEAGESCGEEQMTFVGTLAGGDIVGGHVNEEIPSPVAPLPRAHSARVTPSGAHLAFVSLGRPTGYDNADANSGELDYEVYLYDAGASRLVCASCNPSGARPTGARGHYHRVAAWINTYQFPLYGRRTLSEDGKRLFFNAADALTPRDTNGAQDVYEWEAPGTGSCTTANPAYSAQNGGCVDLISSGESPEDSEFVDASSDGSDVFFRTGESLAAGGRDPGLIDIYDARVGGGEPQPESRPACEGDACQSVPSPPPVSTPATAAHRGPGNVREGGADRCAKPAHKAQRLSRRAGRLRRSAKRVRGAKQAKRMRRKAKRLAHRAHSLSRNAKRCRRARQRRANSAGRAHR